MGNFIKVCPRCGSHKIKLSRTPLVGYLGFHTPNICENCGFSSIIFPEVSRKEAKKIKPAKWEKPEADVGGDAFAKFWIWIIIFLVLIPFVLFLIINI